MDDIETLKHLVDYGVIALLVIMSFIAVFFFIERVLFYKKIDVKSYKTKKALDIALLGTVLAIMLTFMTMGNAGDIDASKIMESLALALKATAAGLVVAIISMVFYNILSRFAEVLESDYEATEI